MKLNAFLKIGTLILLSVIFSCGDKDENIVEPTNVELSEQTIENISYGSDPLQTFDLYLPAKRNKETKTLILVHGGGWTGGDKSEMNGFIPTFKQSFPNYAIANVNYRLAKTNLPAFPMQIDDIGLAISKLKSGNYTISNNFGFIGISAGGHLSLQYAYTKNISNEIKMVCNIVGPTNFTDPNYSNNPEWVSQFTLITGVKYDGQNTAFFEGLSPFYTATTKSPPTIAFYGDTDPLIPTSQGVSLRDKLNSQNVYNEYSLYKGGHGNWLQQDYLDMFSKIKVFVDKKF